MVKHQVFQKLNVLDVDDFSALIAHKDSIINQGKGAVTIHEDGVVITDTQLKEHADKDNPFYADYIVSKEAIFNFKYDIESFLPYMGEPFCKALQKIQEALIEFGVKNPRPYMSRAYRNNRITIWHKHSMMPSMKPSKFWVTILYLHPNWDISNGGDIRIGITENEDLLVAKCYSNSMVAHNGYYGHGVDSVKLGYEGNRDILLNHWVSE